MFNSHSCKPIIINANVPLVIVNTAHNPHIHTFSPVVTWDRGIYNLFQHLIWKAIHATKSYEIVIETCAAFEPRNQFHRGMITLKCVCAFVRKFVFHFKVCSFVASKPKKNKPTNDWFVWFLSFVAIRTGGKKIFNENCKPQNPVLNSVQESDSIEDSNLILYLNPMHLNI